MVDELDLQYFAAQDLYEKTESETDKAAFRALFAKARATNAVLFAFNDDPFVAATWALCEIDAAIGLDEVESMLIRLFGP